MESDPSSAKSGQSPASDRSKTDGGATPGGETHGSLKSVLGELAEYVFYYAAARFDLVRLEARRLLLWGGFWLTVLLVGAAATIAGTVFIFVGLADAFTELFHSRWIADFVTGALLLGSTAIVIYLAVSRVMAFSHAKMNARYEARRQRQLRKFGTDVHQRAAEEHQKDSGTH
jgi:hypothetical protein